MLHKITISKEGDLSTDAHPKDSPFPFIQLFPDPQPLQPAGHHLLLPFPKEPGKERMGSYKCPAGCQSVLGMRNHPAQMPRVKPKAMDLSMFS